ncbi:MAG: MEKHLA domain-containing protein [Chitinophagaceae bacterium]|nr:MEKHLA domain-containing protein [Chitinophagaceae bacterium]
MESNSSDQKQAMLAAIIDSSEDAIISKDLNSRITSWNKAAERMFGYTEAEIIGLPIHMLIPPDRQKEEDEIIAILKQGKRVEHFETVRITKTGKKLNISLTISPLKDANGKIVGASKIARDITRQKQYEERLRIMNELGKSIYTQLDIPAILQTVTDSATRLTAASFGVFFYNKTGTNGEAYALDTFSGISKEAFDNLSSLHSTALFNPAFEGAAIIRSDNIAKDPRYGENKPHSGMPGSCLPIVSYLAVPVFSKNGGIIGGLFFGHPEEAAFNPEHEELAVNIASLAAIALDNAQLYHEINVLNKKKDQFISFASHELKTPLTTIKGYVQLAEMANLPFQAFLPKVTKQIKRLEDITTGLLDLSKIQAGKLDFFFEKSSLREIISESIESSNVIQHIVEIHDLPEDLFVYVDKEKMIQVIVNLLTNAIKYSKPHTKIIISVLRTGDEVQVSITDSGSGIAGEHLEQIFAQFYRVTTHANNTEGMGLGLFIAREIMQAHSGKIWAESELNKGSVFYIQFPVERKTR